MTVKELIEKLKVFDENLIIVYEKYSEYKVLEPDEIKIDKLHPARPDGWVHNFWNVRENPELEQQKINYLVFPGN